ncbi:glycoside hydrolase family 3 protein [Pseudonocardia kujensis]|uniref:glycoside hydrolase family 3 N-terminal domain-containing protein n=1 Tax=Pseudonocardia kujensis TaxID=1128675 RepID=UPI001E447CCF|nr:glycoside hydrolase family 3 N-terminal domain-containing protein [Pseudonocardia kujensis]MCE0768162.1 glycoside hydrolase family 3 protein [Pseudonocardia kujensis]
MRIESFPPGDLAPDAPERPRPPRRRRRAVSVLSAGLVVGALLAGIGVITGAAPDVALSARSQQTPRQAPLQAPEQAPAPEQTPADPRPTCVSLVQALSPRDRLAQRLMVGVEAADPAGAARIVRDSRVGGIFLGGNATALLQGKALDAVQQAGNLPVAVAVDDEGGRVQRIDDLDGPLPSARAMARKTPEQVRALAEERGRQLLARGVTWDLAPDVDVSDQPAASVIGDRSFSNDPAVVTRYAGAFEEGLRQAGVYGVLKHFPGHGHSSGDSHQGRVSVPPLDQLRRADLKPYADLLAKLDHDRVGVMVGHLDVPGLTDDLPSSLTAATYRLLRDEYGFDGMVMTDDLGAMKAVSNRFTLPQASLTALEAGADVALSSNVEPVAPTLDVLQQALDSGRIPAADNDRAVERILAAKNLCRR